MLLLLLLLLSLFVVVVVLLLLIDVVVVVILADVVFVLQGLPIIFFDFGPFLALFDLLMTQTPNQRLFYDLIIISNQLEWIKGF